MRKFWFALTICTVIGRANNRAESGALSAEDECIVASLPVVPPGLNDHYALETKPAAAVSAIYTYTADAPDLTAKEWIMFLPRPQDLPGQKILHAGTTPKCGIVADPQSLETTVDALPGACRHPQAGQGNPYLDGALMVMSYPWL